MPTSSSHALIGGVAGAGMAHAGTGVIRWDIIQKTIEFIPPAPLMGFAAGFLFMVGGWRIVKTMGMKITKLKPVGGFCAETAGAVTLFIVTHYGIPVSTTHTIAGSIIGVGATSRLSGIKWGVAERIVLAWVFTIPFSGSVAACCFLLCKFLIRVL